MQWLQSMDVELFRLINSKLANPLFDVVMPFASGNAFFYPLLLLVAAVLIWKAGRRGFVCVVLLALILPLGDSWICRSIKRAVGRPRPYLALTDVRRPGTNPRKPDSTTSARSEPTRAMPETNAVADKRDPLPTVQATALRAAPVLSQHDSAPGTGSMPSSHAANWFAATMIAFIYYRRSLWFMLPCALLVSLSRIYNGVHYPSDVLAGSILGAGYAATAVWLLEASWQWAGRKWFPIWWSKYPSFVQFGSKASQADSEAETLEPELIGSPEDAGGVPDAPVPQANLDAHWLRLGYLLIAVLLVARLMYIAGDTIQLTGDEAYQWLWSKHLALSYYSKPPFIAYAQWIGTHLFGDIAFGVRFFSPVCTAILSFLLIRFFAREFNARAGFFLLLIVTATPLAAAGATLMTVDVFSVFFWAAAMLAGWRAVQLNSTKASWAWVGLWMGLGFLSKYTALFQWLCWAIFFILWRPARAQLRRPGLYLALLINLVCALPVLIWNQQNHWVTVGHVAGDAKAGEPWTPSLSHLGDFAGFVGSEALLLNPIFFVAMVWAASVFWRRNRQNPRLVYFFSMGAPLFLVYLLYTFHSRVLPNWIAPSVLPLYCLMVAYWDTRWRLGVRAVKVALIVGLALGLPLVILGHDTQLIGKFTHHFLPINRDPLHRARGWKEVAAAAEAARRQIASEGKPAFIIAAHYRLAGEISFYLPAGARDETAVYCRSSPLPTDQFYFWPGYVERKGQNAVFIMELDRDDPRPRPPPKQLTEEFESVEDMGVREVRDHGRLLWPLQIFACRGLR